MAYRIRVIPNKKRRIMRSARAPKISNGMQVIEGFFTCPMPKEGQLWSLPPRAVAEFDAMLSSAVFAKGAVLFVEGREPRGVFLIRSGRVKLSAGSAGGKMFILHIAERGEVIGLPGTISGKPYELTAEALQPVQASFIPREEFLKFLRNHAEAALKVAEIISNIYHATYQEVRCLGLSSSAAEKLARFLLDLISDHKHNTASMRARLTLTHEEIAEMIGSSRETVTRLFADFKRKHLIEVRGSTLVISNKAGLQQLLEA